VIAAVKRALDEAGIRIAVPRRVLAFETLGVDASAEERSTARAGNVARLRGP
jgi:hypothetical protein